MLIEGLRLMVAGMGMVFAFLVLMVLLMNATAMLFEKYSKPVENAEPVFVPQKEECRHSECGFETMAIAIAAVKNCSGN